MAAPLLSLRNIKLTFGGAPILLDATFHVAANDRICLVGRNGSGKSTLLKIAAGQIEPDSGERTAQTGTTIRYLPQEPDLSAYATTLAYVEDGLAPGDDTYRAQYLLEQLSLTGAERPDQLSGGERRRAALARTLAPQPDILLLDEPTNHLDLPAIEWLESELAAHRGALVLISHDRRFLTALSRSTLWLDHGTIRRLDQGFAAFEEWRDELLAQEELDRHKLDRKIAMELDWLRYGVTARRKRNQGRLRALAQLRQTRRQQARSNTELKGEPVGAEASGKLVIEAKGLSKSYGSKHVVRDLSIRIQRGDRIGIVGPNGAGKTTLVNLLTGALAPDAGTARLGSNLQMVTLDQSREALDPDATLSQTLTSGRGDTVMVGTAAKHVMSYLKDFLFKPEQAHTPVGVLSGGERARLMLARAFAKPSNFLVLDEPTNDLDLETLDLLQEMIADYAGTVMLVSHDRDFLDRTVSSTLLAAGDGHWIEYAGGYSDMEIQRDRAPANAPNQSGPSTRATPRKAVAERASVSATPAPSQQARKLTFTEQHELNALPERIDKLQQEADALQAKLGNGDLFSKDPHSFNKLVAELGKLQQELQAAEDRWLALETLRENAQ